MSEPHVDEALLDAALRALTKWGRGANLDRIAQEAGISRVTLYRRGISREAIIEVLVAKGLEEYRAALWPALTRRGPACERLELALRGICGVAENYIGLLEALPEERDRIFHADASGDEELMTRDDFTEPLRKILEEGVADGSLSVDDPVETSTVLFNQVCWTYIHLRRGHRWSPEHARDSVVRLSIEGVGA